MIYEARKEQVSYGEAIGILLLESHIPFPPGDVGNATTYSFPVRYKVVKGASVETLINKQDPALLQPFIDAGLTLVKEGVRAITGDCGFMILFQEQLAKEFPVPVFLSSLLQIPFISRILSPGEEVGVIVANSDALTDDHLRAAGITKSMPIRVAGMQNASHFSSAILEERGVLDSEQMEAEVVRAVKCLVDENEGVKAILLECSDLPPYAAAVQEAVHLPVFDFVTMINYVFSALVRKRFDGFM